MRERRCAMLNSATVKPMIPVKDMRVAGKFYEEKLGLRKVDGSPDTALVYESGDSTLCVYRSEFAGTNKGTAALWDVDNVAETVEELKGKGVTFEHYDDLPGLTRNGDVHATKDVKVAWFKDPDGNILSIQSGPSR
jgi:catechol 2,3-dioxygenase-like lactoylglutathione lyase family enzyme